MHLVYWGWGMSGEMIKNRINAARNIHPMTRSQTSVYCHDNFHEPSVSSPNSGTTDSRISMYPQNLRK